VSASGEKKKKKKKKKFACLEKKKASEFGRADQLFCLRQNIQGESIAYD